MERPLSKSQFVRGMQCPKSLYLYRNHSDLRDETSASQQAIFDAGTEVGILAQSWIGGGVLIKADHRNPQAALDETAAAIAAGASVLYEAAFLHDGVLIRTDILAKNPEKNWDLYEVKSTTAVEDEHLHDVAVQRYVLAGAGLKLGKAHLVHLDPGYVRYGALNLQKLFKAEDVTAQTDGLLAMVPAHLAKMKAVAAAAEAPEIGIGAHCEKPHKCDFYGNCWAHVPEYSVFDIPYAKMDKKLELFNRGVHRVDQVNPTLAGLTDKRSIRAVEVARLGKPVVDKQAISAFLNQLVYPIAHLDFETNNPPVPPYDGLRPYSQMPFQAVVCVQDEPGAPVVEHGFLGDGLADPRAALIDWLVQTIPRAGSVLAYHKSFEAGRLEELAPSVGLGGSAADKFLLKMVDRLADLADPFRTNAYTHPGFKGRWSIKAVLPVLVPSMKYEGLEIGEGTAAMAAYAKLRDPELPTDERERLMNALKIYCAQDVNAMVKILAHLYEVTGAVTA
jgi:uncharacterized protein YunC (DUF1805 family)